MTKCVLPHSIRIIVIATLIIPHFKLFLRILAGVGPRDKILISGCSASVPGTIIFRPHKFDCDITKTFPKIQNFRSFKQFFSSGIKGQLIPEGNFGVFKFSKK